MALLAVTADTAGLGKPTDPVLTGGFLAIAGFNKADALIFICLYGCNGGHGNWIAHSSLRLGTMYIGCNMKICRTSLILIALGLITYVVAVLEGLFDQRHRYLGGAKHPLGH
jgi:hypothetical protein